MSNAYHLLSKLWVAQQAMGANEYLTGSMPTWVWEASEMMQQELLRSKHLGVRSQLNLQSIVQHVELTKQHAVSIDPGTCSHKNDLQYSLSRVNSLWRYHNFSHSQSRSTVHVLLMLPCCCFPPYVSR